LAEEPFVSLPHLPLEFGDGRAHLPLVLSVDDRLSAPAPSANSATEAASQVLLGGVEVGAEQSPCVLLDRPA